MASSFDEVITDHARLREIIGQPGSRIVAKVIDHLDGICRRFIAASPYCVVGTMGADGLLDLSPKGDPAGFVTVLDDKTLVLPDRLGNRRVDTFENLLGNPAITLIFLIPGYAYTLRVAGKAAIVRDTRLQKELAADGKAPDLLTVVTVEEAFMHCAKSIARAKLWKPDEWPALAGVPSLAEAMVAHGKLADSRPEMQAIIDEDFKTRMY
jgi:PPOX class probable FMN-dependent enzyme